MRVLLIYNPNAGDGLHGRLRNLVDLIHAAGHEVRCRSSKDPLARAALTESADLIAVAGGDGTIVKVVRWLRGRKAVIAPLPLGTANNISTALGLLESPLEQQILGWADGQTISMDVGVVRSPRGSRMFLESLGVGLVLQLMDTGAASRSTPRVETQLTRAISRAQRLARRAPAIEVQAHLDGRDVSGRYILFEAMNIGWAGPNLYLTDADPADGQFDVVTVRECERGQLIDCLVARERGEPVPRALPKMRGRRLRIAQTPFALHVDDEVWSKERITGEASAEIEATVHDTAWFLVPPSEAAASAWMRPPEPLRRDQPHQRSDRRFELTPSRWAWPAARRVRPHR